MNSLTINEVEALTDELRATESSIELKKSWLVEGAFNCLCKTLATAQDELTVILRALEAAGYTSSANEVRNMQQAMVPLYFSARDMINAINRGEHKDE